MKQCRRCGKKLPNDARICAYCGLKLTTQQSSGKKTTAKKQTSSGRQTAAKRDSYDRYRKQKMQQEIKKKRRRRRIRILIFWLLVLAIAGAVFGGMYANKHYSSVINPSTEPTGEVHTSSAEPEKSDDSEDDASTPKPTKEPEVTPAATSKAQTLDEKAENSGCVVYEDSSYDFKCAYPADFVEGTLKTNNTRVSFKDENGGAEMLINFEKTGKSDTAEKLLEDYLNKIGVDPDVDNSGDNFYSVTFTRGGRINHRKAVISDGKYIYYDFMYDQGSDSKSKYEDYIDFIDMYLEQANKTSKKKTN